MLPAKLRAGVKGCSANHYYSTARHTRLVQSAVLSRP